MFYNTHLIETTPEISMMLKVIEQFERWPSSLLMSNKNHSSSAL